MPIQVEVPGQGIVEFPDGMTDDQISSAIKKNSNPTSAVGDALDSFAQYAKNNTMGALRGAAGIGTTLLRPLDATGITGTTNADRKASIEQFFNETADTGSFGFGAGKLGAEVAGTAGVGGAIAKPIAGIAPKLAAAIQSGGMVANGAGMPTRMAGGAIAGGASAGLIDPESAGTGAAIGAALPPSVKLAGAVGRGVGSLVEPFYKGGRERILGRALRSAAGNQADDALRNLQTAQPLVQGSQPTAGMAAQNPGIAALERASMANSPVATNELALRQAANNEARIAAMEGIAPNRDAALAAREGATSALYSQSSQAPVKVTPELANLLQRPSMQGAVSRASKLAEEAGEVLDLNNLTGRTAQYLKMALDDMANSAPMTGIGGNELRAIQGTRQAYLDELGKQVPEYLQANAKYAEMSRPITQSDVIGEIGKKATSFRGDFTPAAYARALQDKTAQSVTGRASSTLANTLEPKQLSTLNNIKQDLLNQDFAQTAGRGVGSNTVQNLAYTNMLDQFGIPTAMREFAPLGAVGNVLGQAGRVGYKSANERLADELAKALLDPQAAAELMDAAKKGVLNPNVTQMLANSLRVAPVLSAQ